MEPVALIPQAREDPDRVVEMKPHRVVPCEAQETAVADEDSAKDKVMEALMETDAVAAAPIKDEPKMKYISSAEISAVIHKLREAKDSWQSVVEALETVVIANKETNVTLLHCFAGDKTTRGLTEYLLKAGVPVDSEDASGSTPLYITAVRGDLHDCKLLCAHGADCRGFRNLFAANLPPVEVAVKLGHHDVATWLLNHPNYHRLWSDDLFAMICERSPNVLVTYLSLFAVDFQPQAGDALPVYGNLSIVSYHSLQDIYGKPSKSVTSTVLSMVIKTSVASAALGCQVMRYIIKAKWHAFGEQMFRQEVVLYSALLTAFGVSVICDQGTNWSAFYGFRDYMIGFGRIVAAGVSTILLAHVERRELRVEGPAYFFSFWNLLAVGTYIGVILIAVIQAFGFQSELLQAAISVLNVTLWVNMFQYLQMAASVAVLITMMSHMVSDVAKFIVLYTVFLFGFSGGFYVLLFGRPGYETFIDALITVLLMLFGQITYDPFNAATGLTWVVSNLLLLAYLVSVAIVLLNLLIAMMSTSYSNVWEEAEGQVLLSYAQIIVRMEKSLTKADRVKQFKMLKTNGERGKREQALRRIPGKSDDQRRKRLDRLERVYRETKELLADPSAVSLAEVVVASFRYLYVSVILNILHGGYSGSEGTTSPLGFNSITKCSILEDGERLEYGHKKPTTDEQAARVDALSTQVEELKTIVERQAVSLDRQAAAVDRQTALIESLSGFVREHAARREATAFL